MSEWMYNKHGSARLILDDSRVRDSRGSVVGWLSGGNVYSLRGQHIGWFEGGVIYDSSNRALAFVRDHSGYLPYLPGLGGLPGMPGFAGIPGRPGFSGTPGRPGYGGWSEHDADEYFCA
jgi:hypothetical protein